MGLLNFYPYANIKYWQAFKAKPRDVLGQFFEVKNETCSPTSHWKDWNPYLVLQC